MSRFFGISSRWILLLTMLPATGSGATIVVDLDGSGDFTEIQPAIDAGTCAGVPDHDLDGDPRPLGAGCDIGAYEAPGSPPARFARGEMNGDGTLDLSDMIYNLVYQFGGGPTPRCLKAADVNDDGGIDISDPIFGLLSLFMEGATIPPPLRLCGLDPTGDSLTCGTFEGCP